MEKSSGQLPDRNRQANKVLSERRATLKLSHEKLAYLVCAEAKERRIQIGTLDSVTRHIKRIEAGHVREPSKIYRSLLCTVLKMTEVSLFGTIHSSDLIADNQVDRFKLRNNKLIPMFIGASAAERAIGNLKMQPSSHPIRGYNCTLDHPRLGVTSHLWVWPFGVAMFHIAEDVEFSSLAKFAIWHRSAYDEQMAWANKKIKFLLDSSANAQYAMPINWVVRSIWGESHLDSALRILSTPRILLHRTARTDTSDLAQAQLAERALLQRGVDQLETCNFGVDGISFGVASWSGIVYFPIAINRALSEPELLMYELTVQAAWSYCDWIRGQVERGEDPDVRSQYGWRLIRALQSFITNPRPEENPQFYPLRSAVLATSGITEHLNQATAAMRWN